MRQGYLLAPAGRGILEVTMLSAALFALTLTQTVVKERPVIQSWTGAVTEVKGANTMIFVASNNRIPIKVRLYGLDVKGLPKSVAGEATKLIAKTALRQNCAFAVLFHEKDLTPVGRLL